MVVIAISMIFYPGAKSIPGPHNVKERMENLSELRVKACHALGGSVMYTGLRGDGDLYFKSCWTNGSPLPHFTQEK